MAWRAQPNLLRDGAPICESKAILLLSSPRHALLVSDPTVLICHRLNQRNRSAGSARLQRPNNQRSSQCHELVEPFSSFLQVAGNHVQSRRSARDRPQPNVPRTGRFYSSPGSYGSVYKGYFVWDGLTVAVKVLNLQQRGASRSFLTECEALKNVRHRNLIKVLASCSSIDFKGNDFKALVLQYMPNGSLEEWLHPKTDKEDLPRSLNLIQRLNIAVEVAYALDYLHNYCETPISHCDLKPSNILLDVDMVAHVSDFGIARFVYEAVGDHFRDKTNSIAIKGTIGYVAPDGQIVAVKVLNLQRQGASRSFLAECEALRNVRHPNLVKILASCSSIDFKGNDFKALVFKYIPNGSLEEWLHPKVYEEHQPRTLNLIQRLNIAIDVAYALDYLHHHCQTPISHCDLKPSNVLLDNDMVAHVCDFGIARFLSVAVDDNSTNKTNSIAVKGSIGYVAPEYGMGGNVSTAGDVYSFGILLLEMFTGKRPTEDMFKDGLNLHEFVKMALPDQVLEMVDPRLLEEQKEEQEQDQEIDEEIAFNHIRSPEVKRGSVFGCFVSLFGIGVACSVESPRERMLMKDIVNKMHVMRDTFLGAGIYREGRNKTLR